MNKSWGSAVLVAVFVLDFCLYVKGECELSPAMVDLALEKHITRCP